MYDVGGRFVMDLLGVLWKVEWLGLGAGYFWVIPQLLRMVGGCRHPDEVLAAAAGRSGAVGVLG